MDYKDLLETERRWFKYDENGKNPETLAVKTLAAISASNYYEGQYYGGLRATNATQSLKQRVGIAAGLNQYMTESGINGDWTKNNTISSLITNAFTS